LTSTDESARRQNPEDHHRHRHRRENLKSLILAIIFLPEPEQRGTEILTHFSR
jgi:hypothetical protein